MSLLAQQRILGDKISAAAGHIGESVYDKGCGGGLGPLFEKLVHLTTKSVPEI